MTGAPVLGVDPGGTAVKLVLERADGGVADRAQFPTPVDGDAAGRLRAEVVAFLRGRDVAAAGLTVPGLIDPDGTVLTCANLPWLEGRRPGAELSAALGVPVEVLNDGEAAARAEAVHGAGRGHADVYVVTLGTGITGKHVVGGEVRRGAHLAAGEIGHISLDPHGAPCSCGQRGCLETVAGGAHLVRLSHRRGTSAATARDVVDAARRGDPGATAVVDAAVDGLASVLLGVIAAVDPGLVVVGGGLAQAEDVVVAPVVEAVRERATFHRVPEFTRAVLGPWAGASGAALAARTGAARPVGAAS